MRFEADVTLPDGVLLEAGSVHRKRWRIRSEETTISDALSLSIVRDAPSDEEQHVQSHILPTQASFELCSDGCLEVATDLTAPLSSGVFRFSFRLYDSSRGTSLDLWCEFCVVAHPDDLEEVRATLQQAALTQRVGLGAAPCFH